ncbi:MAG: phosphodiester glycosidase family protein [Candidatus Marinimicrobia bacterium]|nr:phosphodiester glycosidase family protein [Candidatus Neomarinimicrobiota bacterium]MBT3946521.1 phosphodiester glycosidase family protein [Candidatus Neomarinimicrobiota bacterium]MBT4154699.1 phosphodiester glycosidase family protein [Candidatus Neomarinimicrobiota bacterium]MBT4554964.1 phosphodiester glycosidase family protein [Candidatus Neomarinimicrobiota bacterium]MBT4753250.1 phosphodiester glycosidase family protein [Candidatus Neomarinimicrobiota bacterium]
MKQSILFILAILFACEPAVRQKEIQMNWHEFDLDLPNGIVIYSGTNKSMPLNAWVATVDLNQVQISVNVLSSTDKDRKESPLQFMENSGARIILNGGYFLMDHQPAQHVGLLKTNGNLEEAASPSVIRDQSRYFINRGAFGIKNDGTVDIAWCSTKNDSIFEWDAPLQNRPGLPQDSLHFQTAKFWDVKDAFHAGPVLINDGKINVTVEQEAFFNTPIAGVQPRSAIGYTKDNVLILMVVDGRQVDSRGVYLEELALLMNQFNCIEALNLDGGGSSAMVADSRLLNRPGGLTLQREIMSVIGIFYNNYIE